MDIPQHAEVILLVLKVSEGCEQAASQIVARGANKIPHVLVDPFDGSARFGRVFARLVQQKGRAVYASDLKSALSKLNGVASRPAAEIEHAAAAALRQRKDAADFLRRGGKPLGGKHEGIEFAPEIVIFKPFHG